MGKWIYNNEAATGVTIGQGVTANLAINGNRFDTSSEATVQTKLRYTYTARRLWCNVTNIDGTCTLTDRINGGAGGQSISITTTGQKEDLTGTTSLINGSLYNLRGVTSGSHGNTCTIHCVSVILDDEKNNTPAIIGSTNSCSFGIAIGFTSPFGVLQNRTLGPSSSVNVSGVLSNLRMYVLTNTFGVSETFNLTKNGANTQLSLSLGAGVTGELENTSGVVSFIPNNTIRFDKTSSGTGGSATISILDVGCSGLANYPLCGSDSTSSEVYTSAAVTNYWPLCGALDVNTTESQVQTKCRTAAKFDKLRVVVVSSSTRPEPTLIDLRANGSSPTNGPAVIIASGNSGEIIDLTGSYIAQSTDLVNYRIVTSGSTGSTTIGLAGAQQSTPSISGICNLFMKGYDIKTSGIDLFISNIPQASSGINLYVSGVPIPSESGNIDLFISGVPNQIDDSMNLFIKSSGNPNPALYYVEGASIYKATFENTNKELSISPVGSFSFGGIPFSIVRVDEFANRIFYPNLSSVLRSSKLDGTDILSYNVSAQYDIDRKNRNIYARYDTSGIIRINYDHTESGVVYYRQIDDMNPWFAVNPLTENIYFGFFSGISNFIGKIDYDGNNFESIEAPNRTIALDFKNNILFTSTGFGISGVLLDTNTLYPIKFDATIKFGFALDTISGMLYYYNSDNATLNRISYSGTDLHVISPIGIFRGLTNYFPSIRTDTESGN